jgi:uncharacterized membrane protein
MDTGLSMELLTIIRIFIGSAFVLFLPGFVWTYVFFNRSEIDIIERIALSFGLSIALVPLVMFYANYLLGVKITLINCIIIVVILILLPLGWFKLKKQTD